VVSRSCASNSQPNPPDHTHTHPPPIMDFRHKHTKRVLPRVATFVPEPPVLLGPAPEIVAPTRVLGRSPDSTDSSDSSQTSCPGGDGSGKCQKGVGSSTFTLPIVLGIV
jgi:hypothetical protein